MLENYIISIETSHAYNIVFVELTACLFIIFNDICHHLGKFNHKSIHLLHGE